MNETTVPASSPDTSISDLDRGSDTSHSGPVRTGDTSISTFAEAEAILATRLTGYQPRPAQQELARAIEAILAEGGTLLGEGPTGTGKSIAYLIPAILSGRRVVVSTATKALQDQLASKDLPFLAEHLPVAFTFTVLKGRSNYICANRALGSERADAVELANWMMSHEFFGERHECPTVDDRLWREVSANTDECQALECRKQAKDASGVSAILCGAERARRVALLADVVVVNHALLLTDAKVREVTGGYFDLLGDYETLVCDEAHQVEEYAASAFGGQITLKGAKDGLSAVVNLCQAFDSTWDPSTEVATLHNALDDLWETLEEGRLRLGTILEAEELWVTVVNGITDLTAEVAGSRPLDSVPTGEYERATKRRDRIVGRLRALEHHLMSVILGRPDEVVRWVESDDFRGQTRLLIRYAPIEVADHLREMLWGREGLVAAVLTSATMTVAGKGFDYIAERLGLDDPATLAVPSPFDFATQARLYVGEDLPLPSGGTAAQWQQASIDRIERLVMAAGGGALLLFTSTSHMRRAYEALAPRLPYRCFMQTQRSNRELAADFMADVDSVLFATRSFYEGVDVQGDACRLVVLDKLPFPVPTEPVTEARCEAIEAKGGNSFVDYTVPVMSLPLIQGTGRLIRTVTDRGVMAILDPRLTKKGYGKKIVQALPPAPVVKSIDEVAAFFGEAR